MELKQGSTTYILPLDSIDINLLSIRQHGNDATIPIWSASKSNDEYYEFELYTEAIEDSDCVETEERMSIADQTYYNLEIKAGEETAEGIQPYLNDTSNPSNTDTIILKDKECRGINSTALENKYSVMELEETQKAFDPFKSDTENDKWNIQQHNNEEETNACIADDWYNISDDDIVFETKTTKTANMSENIDDGMWQYDDFWYDTCTVNIPKGFEISNSALGLFCNVCRVITPITDADIKIHVEGSKHKALLALDQQSKEEYETLKNIANSLFGQHFESTDNIKLLFCNICKIKISIKDADIKIHVDSFRHKAILGLDQLSKEEYETLKNIAKSQFDHFESNRNLREFFCKICKVKTSSEAGIKEHVNGSKHRTLVAALLKEESDTLNTSTSIATTFDEPSTSTHPEKLIKNKTKTQKKIKKDGTNQGPSASADFMFLAKTGKETQGSLCNIMFRNTKTRNKKFSKRFFDLYDTTVFDKSTKK